MGDERKIQIGVKHFVTKHYNTIIKYRNRDYRLYFLLVKFLSSSVTY